MRIKKILFIILIILFVSFAFGCNRNNNGEGGKDPGDIINPDNPDDPGDPDDPDNPEDPIENIDEIIQKKCEEVLQSMSLGDKISQTIMLAFRYIPDTSTKATYIDDTIKDVIKAHAFSGVILFAHNSNNNIQTFNLIDSFQKANSEISGRSQLLVAVDQEGGKITRLEEGTQTPGNMALGALNSSEDTEIIAELIGSELSALGFNVDFGPVVDVNNNPNNPVIGVRSFSDSPSIVASMGASYVKGMNNANVIATLKHYPGHGDTATDSHTGLPCINKTYEEIMNNELVPYKEIIKSGVEMIMTAHIQYPLIETNTYTSNQNGEEIYLPSTLSNKMINEILRDELGFDGVVITDALEMAAIRNHFDVIDTYKLAIEAGVDILLMPVDTATTSGINSLHSYINTISEKVNNGEISLEAIDKAVMRILKLKAKHGLLDAYDTTNYDERLNKVSIVGSKEHHDIEWEVTKKAITLVKNDNNLLPLIKENENTVVLTAYDNEVLGMEYARSLLIDEGKLPKNSSIEVHSYQGKSFDDTISWIDGKDNVIIVSEMSGSSFFSGNSAKLIDSVISYVHSHGGKVIIMSVQLPYDIARFPDADAIVLTYSAKSMSEDPRVSDGNIKQYGPNMPACLYVLFSKEDKPLGKLPVEVKALDSKYKYTDTILYERGFGLSYGE